MWKNFKKIKQNEVKNCFKIGYQVEYIEHGNSCLCHMNLMNDIGWFIRSIVLRAIREVIEDCEEIAAEKVEDPKLVKTSDMETASYRFNLSDIRNLDPLRSGMNIKFLFVSSE